MDLSADFADFSDLNCGVVEVRNTFLHVRPQSDLNAAAASDFVCNYADLANGAASLETPKGRSRRPGKKARARMARRNTVTSMASLSTEASLDLPSEPSECSATLETPCDDGGRCPSTTDECQSSASSAISAASSSSSSTSENTADRESNEAPHFHASEMSSKELTDGENTRRRVASLAAPFIAGALSMLVMLGLLWCMGGVHVGFHADSRTHSCAEAIAMLKHDMQRQFAERDDALGMVVSQLRAMQPHKYGDQGGQGIEVLESNERVSTLESFHGVGEAIAVDAPLSEVFNIKQADQQVQTWLPVKIFVAVWLVLVSACSLSTFSAKVHAKPRCLDEQADTVEASRNGAAVPPP